MTNTVKGEIKMNENTKFCKHCGNTIPEDAVICTHCGRQVEKIGGDTPQPQVVINNTNANVNSNTNYVGAGCYGNPKSKTTAIILCCCGFFGIAGLHKFYEGKTGSGILYLCTIGWCFIGTIIDLIALLGKPSTYYV